MSKRLLALLLALAAALLLVSCAAASDDGLPSVVTTNFALYDFARAVCGDRCRVTMLLSPGAEAHDFEATLEDVAKIAEAELFVYVGGESEDWVEDVWKTLGDEADGIETVCAMQAVRTFEEETVEGMEPENAAPPHWNGDFSSEPAADEHVWTSFENASALAEAICEAVSRIDPEGSAVYEANLTAFRERTDALRERYAETVAQAARHTIVVADRFPFRYLAEEWELDYYAAFSGCSSAVEPSLSTVNFLIEQVKNEGVPAVFIIEFSDGRTASAVQAETGCEVLTLHSAHNVSREDFDAGVTWLELMERNLGALQTALN